ncbi:MAG TPA: hypothetical protein VFM25_04170 [Verrucomicrobiae bacterium]|jgi:uncharacterized iron-regulated membrane protein|nr:hypothetical protein [Verrucomicrobiae bacterium]
MIVQTSKGSEDRGSLIILLCALILIAVALAGYLFWAWKQKKIGVFGNVSGKVIKRDANPLGYWLAMVFFLALETFLIITIFIGFSHHLSN